MTTDGAGEAQAGDRRDRLLDPALDLPAHDGPPRSYLIAFTARSGSTLLADLLRGTGRLGVPGEYLHPARVVPLAERLGVRETGGRIILDRYLAAVARVRSTPNGRFGLKLLYEQVDHHLDRASMRALLRSCPIVWMRRRDRLAQVVSHDIALQSGRWSLRDGDTTAARATRFDQRRFPVLVGRLLREEFLWERLFAGNGLAPHVVWYEDLIADPDAVCRAVCAFLGEEPGGVFSIERAQLRRQAGPINAAWRERLEAPLRLAPPLDAATGCPLPPRACVVATTPRAGGRLLAALLRRSGRMGRPSEYLDRALARRYAAALGLDPSGPDLLPQGYVEAVLARMRGPDGVFSITVHWSQIAPALAVDAVRRLIRHGRIVRLRRRDVLAQAVSLAVARARRVQAALGAIRPRPAEAMAAPAFDGTAIDASLAETLLQDWYWDRLVEANGLLSHPAWYEDLVDDPDRVCRAICALVGVADAGPFSLDQARTDLRADPVEAAWQARVIRRLRL